MKILHVVTLSEVGGAQKVLFNIVKGLNKKGFQFHVACAPGGEMVDWLRGIGVLVYEIPELVRPISPIMDIKALMKLRKIIKDEKYDLVHCHSSKAGILGRLAAWLSGVPRIVFTVHGWGVNDQQSFFMRSLFGIAERAAGWVSTDVVCVSKADYKLGKKFVHEKKLKVIYNGVETQEEAEKTDGNRGKIRWELGIRDDDIIIAMVARLKKPKEPLFFLRVGERIIEAQGKSIHFVLVGDGLLREECESFLQERKLEEQMHLLGTREDMLDLYGDFDIFALFSSWEGLPLTICEAMRAGLPVVASQVGGVGEQIIDGWNGFLVKDNDKDDHNGEYKDDKMKEAIGYLEKLIMDEKLRREMGENSKRRGEEMFTVDRMIREYEEMYVKLLDK